MRWIFRLFECRPRTSWVGAGLREVRHCGVRVRGRPALQRSGSADVALSEKSPYLGGAWVRLDLWQSISLTGGNLETIESRAIGDE